MKKQCKIIKYGKNGMAIILPKAYTEFLELEIGNVVELTLDKKKINTKELTLYFTDKKEKE